MQPSALLSTFWEERASAILRTDDTRLAADAMDAAIRGGFRIVEFTLTIPGALDLVRDFSRRPGVVVGAGTVLTPEAARKACAAGARFLVSPVVDEDVIHVARDLGVVSIPGVHTPTELLRAHRAGAELQKLFPAPAGGPTWVRSVLGPMPFLRIVPTNGVDGDNVGAWIEAGVWGVGFVGALFEPAALGERRFDRIEARARELLAATRTVARARPPAAADPFAPSAGQRPLSDPRR